MLKDSYHEERRKMNEFLVNLTDEWTKFPFGANNFFDGYNVKLVNNMLHFCVISDPTQLRKEYAGVKFGMVIQDQAYVEQSGGIEDFCFSHGVPRLPELLLPFYNDYR